MNENTITITLDEYKELLKKAERIDTLERMYEGGCYVSDDDVKTVLGIKKAKEEAEND